MPCACGRRVCATKLTHSSVQWCGSRQRAVWSVWLTARSSTPRSSARSSRRPSAPEAGGAVRAGDPCGAAVPQSHREAFQARRHFPIYSTRTAAEQQIKRVLKSTAGRTVGHMNQSDIEPVAEALTATFCRRSPPARRCGGAARRAHPSHYDQINLRRRFGRCSSLQTCACGWSRDRHAGARGERMSRRGRPPSRRRAPLPWKPDAA